MLYWFIIGRYERLASEYASRSTPTIPKASSVEQLLQASSSSEASPSPSLKIVIKRKDLKLPNQNTNSGGCQQPSQDSANATTLARSLLSAKLAKAAAAETGAAYQQRLFKYDT